MKKDKNSQESLDTEPVVAEDNMVEKLMSSEDDQIIELDEQGDIVIETVFSEEQESVAENPTVETTSKTDTIEAPSFAKKAFSKYEQSEVDNFVEDLVAKYNALVAEKTIADKKAERKTIASTKATKDLSEARKTIKSLEIKIKELEDRTPDDEALKIIDAANKEAEIIIAEANAKAISAVSHANNESISISNKAHSNADLLKEQSEKHAIDLINNAQAQAKDIISEAKTEAKEMLETAIKESNVVKAEAEQSLKKSEDFLSRRHEVSKRLKDFYQTQIDLLNSEENTSSE